MFVKKEYWHLKRVRSGNQYSVMSKSVVRLGQGCGVHLLLILPAGLK